jgi:hypothetical protein
MSHLPADQRLAELRQHVELNYTTDARVAIAWAVERIQDQTSLLRGIASCAEFTACDLCRDLLKPYSALTRSVTTTGDSNG